jgi:hypothetical protein
MRLFSALLYFYAKNGSVRRFNFSLADTDKNINNINSINDIHAFLQNAVNDYDYVNNTRDVNNTIKPNKFDYKGYDGRHPLEPNATHEEIEIRKIKLLYKKKDLLDTLEDKNVSIVNKLILIEEMYNYNSIQKTNITAGGLMKDFGFEFGPGFTSDF